MKKFKKETIMIKITLEDFVRLIQAVEFMANETVGIETRLYDALVKKLKAIDHKYILDNLEIRDEE